MNSTDYANYIRSLLTIGAMALCCTQAFATP